MKDRYFLCEDDIIVHIPSGQVGYIRRIFEDDSGMKYELILLSPDRKLWAKWDEIELRCPVG